jgi:hypothetical protein
MNLTSSYGGVLNRAADLLKLADQAGDDLVSIGAVEVSGAGGWLIGGVRTGALQCIAT